MQPFQRCPIERLAAVRFVLTDIDDTLTQGPRLPAAAYDALERLSVAGYRVIPITAASAGWCDLMCRMWPVAAVIGENGGLCFRYDLASGVTDRRYWASEGDRRRDHARLAALAAQIRQTASGGEPSSDQSWREVTLAFRNAGRGSADRIAAQLTAAGARAVINSLWVLGWFAGFDKLAMTRRMLAELFAVDIECDCDAFIYVGDSMNDEPMFGFFRNSVGVATVRGYAARMLTPPQWITSDGGGAGFVEVADTLLNRDSIGELKR